MTSTVCDICGKPINWAVKIRTAVTMVPHVKNVKMDQSIIDQFKKDEEIAFTTSSLYSNREHDVCFRCAGKLHASILKEVESIQKEE